MSRLFGRDYNMTIKSSGGRRKVISKLRIDFEIVRSTLSYPNSAKIDLYNCNDDTLGRLKEKLTGISLNIGYIGNLGLVFDGQINNVFQRREPPNNIVTIYAGDSQQSWGNARVNRTYKENVKMIEIIRDVASSFGLGEPQIKGLNASFAPPGGQSFSDGARDIMDSLALDLGFSWSIQNGVVMILGEGATVNESGERIVINSDSGLIGSPTITEIGVNVTSRLNHKIAPGSLIKIESTGANVALNNLQQRRVERTTGTGIYKVLESTYKGSFRRDGKGPWQVTAVGETL